MHRPVGLGVVLLLAVLHQLMQLQLQEVGAGREVGACWHVQACACALIGHAFGLVL
jgi:hypothetical protein